MRDRRVVADDTHLDTDRLPRLSDQERATLDLLGDGHTAKSIAALTGRSLSSVNGSLRRARRKTKANSSRELARLLRDKKFGDDEIELVTVRAAEREPRHSRWRAGVIVMMTATAALLLATTLMPSLEAPQAPLDPVSPI